MLRVLRYTFQSIIGIQQLGIECINVQETHGSVCRLFNFCANIREETWWNNFQKIWVEWTFSSYKRTRKKKWYRFTWITCSYKPLVFLTAINTELDQFNFGKHKMQCAIRAQQSNGQLNIILFKKRRWKIQPTSFTINFRIS